MRNSEQSIGKKATTCLTHTEADAQGVRSFDRDLATAQFSQFLYNAVETQADLVVTPEYAMPWDVLLSHLKKGVRPSQGKLWVLGCESIKLSDLEKAKNEIAPYATMLYEPLKMENERFLGPLVYVFLAPALAADSESEDRLVVLCQFKTNPMCGGPKPLDSEPSKLGYHIPYSARREQKIFKCENGPSNTRRSI